MTAKSIKSIEKVDLLESGDAVFEFVLEDGTREKFQTKASYLTDLVLKFSSISLAQAAGQGTFQPDFHIAYENGKGRVLLRLNTGAQRLELVLGHLTAKNMGAGLVEAAKKSLE